jgi:hypothetical protein
MSDKITSTIQQIKMAFPPIQAPLADWESCKTVGDFLTKFGDDFFLDFWPTMHDNFSVTRFMLPYIMEFFLLEKSESSSDAVDYFIGTLDPVAQRETQLDHSVEKLFRSLNLEQRKAVCDWMKVIQEKYEFLFNVERTKGFWCQTTTEQ